MSGVVVRKRTACLAAKKLLGLDGKMSLSGQTTRGQHKEGLSARRPSAMKSAEPGASWLRRQPQEEITLFLWSQTKGPRATRQGCHNSTRRGRQRQPLPHLGKTDVNRVAAVTPGHAPGLMGASAQGSWLLGQLLADSVPYCCPQNHVIRTTLLLSSS